MRGATRYNTSIMLSDKKAKTDGIDAAKRDLLDAYTLSTESVKLIKSLSSFELFYLDSQETAKLNVLAAHAESTRLLATITDKTKANEALEAMHEYISSESNQEKIIDLLRNTNLTADERR